jgi:N-acetylneuraminate synthase
VEKALGRVSYHAGERESQSRVFRRSLFVVKDVKAGEPFTRENVRSIRPGVGLHTRYLEEVIGHNAACDLERGTPLSLAHVCWNLENN